MRETSIDDQIARTVRAVLHDHTDPPPLWRRLGYLEDRDLTRLAANEQTRLIPCLVRCDGCRFAAPAQDVARLIAMVEHSGDAVRDVSSLDVARAFNR